MTTLETLQKQVDDLTALVGQFKKDYSIHQHNNVDGTNNLRKTITLDQDQVFVTGSLMIGSSQGFNAVNGRNYFGVTAVGPQMQQTTTNQFPNYQLVIRHFPDDTDRLSILYGASNPIVVSFQSTSLTTTNGGNTVTIVGYNFPVNSLINAWINIYNSSGVMVEAHKILSNTATVITIEDTWLHTTSNAFFEIYASSYLGDFMHLWKQLYLEMGADNGGIRFGPGLFSGGQQSALYVDPSDGSLWYQYPSPGLAFNISGAIVNLSAGVTGNFFASSDGVNLDLHVFVNDGIITAII